MDQIIDSIKPNIKEVTELSRNVSRVILEPFEPHFAQIVGTALRRIMLSSIPGYAITAVEIDGVVHEYSAVEGIQEDILLILLNLKEVAVAAEGSLRDEPVLQLKKKGVGPVTAADILCPRANYLPFNRREQRVKYAFACNSRSWLRSSCKSSLC